MDLCNCVTGLISNCTEYCYRIMIIPFRLYMLYALCIAHLLETASDRMEHGFRNLEN